jgi:hypothetical protein
MTIKINDWRTEEKGEKCSCGRVLKEESRGFDPSRGLVVLYECECGIRRMVFQAVKKDQTRAHCGECELYYIGCSLLKNHDTLACKNFKEER